MNKNLILKVEIDYSFKALLDLKIGKLVAGAFLHNIDIFYKSTTLAIENFNLMCDLLIADIKENDKVNFKILREEVSAECTITTNRDGNFVTISPLHSNAIADDIIIDLRTYIKMLLDLCSYMQIMQLSTETI